jgi:hypothetical protein
MFQRGQQPQHRALVQLCARRQFGQSERAVATAKSRKQRQRAIHRRSAAWCGIAVGDRFGLGFAGHGVLWRDGSEVATKRGRSIRKRRGLTAWAEKQKLGLFQNCILS